MYSLTDAILEDSSPYKGAYTVLMLYDDLDYKGRMKVIHYIEKNKLRNSWNYHLQPVTVDSYLRERADWIVGCRYPDQINDRQIFLKVIKEILDEIRMEMAVAEIADLKTQKAL